MPRRFIASAILAFLVSHAPVYAEALRPVVERLARGAVAVHRSDGTVFVSWRLLADDPEGVAFNIYRGTAPPPHGQRGGVGPPAAQSTGDRGPTKLNDTPLTSGTWFIDRTARLDRETKYSVRAVVDGVEGEPHGSFVLPANAEPLPYFSIPIQTPAGYTPNDASLGDLDGDGDYEIVLKQEQNPRDNAHAGMTGETLLQAYKFDGTLLWTINLGKNIREGAHYTMFMVIDLDGDGRAEVACKTADGTVDGTGKIIGDANADWREGSDASVPTRDRTGATETSAGMVARLEGRIVRGPEYLTVFDGFTGAALATADYIPGRHPDTQNPTAEQMTSVWGDGYANRSDRFLAGVAYLDGHLPSLIFCRGYYTRSVITAWDYRDGALTSRWVFDSDKLGPPDRSNPWRGQGNHQLSIADVERGEVHDGTWQPGRKMSGDDMLLNYSLAGAAAAGQSGSGLQFGPDGPTLQRVTLYRY